ncbi:MAG: hypothetical protein HY675_19245 [Chloroflexi bacterium]|nr:hypothetical protein [Chloroflexota bacterium]
MAVVVGTLSVFVALALLVILFPRPVVRAFGRIQRLNVIRTPKGREILPADYAWMTKLLFRQSPEEHISMLKKMIAEPEEVPSAILLARAAAALIALFSGALLGVLLVRFVF